MQWLIDIVKDWIVAQGYLTHSFVDRGDPAAYDFKLGDFLIDDVTHDLDLSGIVPSKAKGVLLYCSIKGTAINESMRIRKKGNSWFINISKIRIQVANIYATTDMSCPIGSGGLLQYRTDGYSFSYLNVCVKGWWL